MHLLDIFSTFLTGAAATTITFLAAGWYGKRSNREKISRKSSQQMEEQLPAFLDTLASGLSAGNSLQQSMDICIRKAPDPLMTFVQKILLKHKSGLSLEDALKSGADEISTGSMSLALNSIAACYRSGSNMVEALSLLATLCRERSNLRKKILARTAQSRMQGSVIVAVPLVFMILLYIVSPQNMIPVIRTDLGRNIMAAALLLQTIGALLIRRVLKQEIL
ncbi:MAG: type II secretion system F family protein [bacterium]|nr:type II secretion system F family protein [bacterium]